VSNQRNTNRLIDATSPYLLQHAHNPVDWHPWSEEALARAQREDRPVLVSIGYSACHWCHVMERESFEDEEIAQVMNENFVCIKVDREERPDLDEVYMTAVQLMTGSGGWPLNVFLTPDLEPFYGGTYFPPENRYGKPGFKTVLLTVARAYRERRREVAETAERVRDALAKAASSAPGSEDGLDGGLIQQAIRQLSADFDAEWGGFGPAPKFPNAMAVALLLRHHYRTGSAESLEMATVTLDKMAQGGMYDHLGGGFARYSTDREWLVPHFEKMLYDNALLADVYLQAFQVTGKPFYAQVARETFDYILRDMTDERGGFHSAEDADSEGVEGRFYVWDLDEVRGILGEADAQRFAEYYGMTPGGNFEGRNVLHVPEYDPHTHAELGPLREQLLAVRSQRERPARDDKVLTDWNGLTIGALARGYQVLGDERYRSAADRAANFLWAEMRSDGRLLHSCRAGKSHISGYLDDYAFLIQGLVDLYDATFGGIWLRRASELADEMIRLFWDSERGGFHFTPADRTDLIIRPKKLHDGATPSGNGIAALALLKLGELTGEDAYREKAEDTLKAVSGAARRAPRAFASLLLALDWHLEGSTQVVISGRAGDAATEALVEAGRKPYVPNRVLALMDPLVTPAGDPALASALTEGKPPLNGRPAAYVCRGRICLPPVTIADELSALLAGRAVTPTREGQSWPISSTPSPG
jgi:uncharacterized protein YyaL (SSP411 family)